ncbi:MAG: ribonucleoside-diphosphate reductase subunit alpha [Chlamydiia bacterium]
MDTSQVKNTNGLSLTVVKRNGHVSPFTVQRIHRAIAAAFKDVKKTEDLTPFSEEIGSLTEMIVSFCIQESNLGKTLTVEGIQDLVEITLMKKGLHDVARGYITYRNERKAERDQSVESVRLYRRDGSTLVRLNPMKVASSIELALRTGFINEGQNIPEMIIEMVNLLTTKVLELVVLKWQNKEHLTVHVVQDLIEEALMEGRHFGAAKAYILKQANEGKVHPKAKPRASDAKAFPVKTKNAEPLSITEEEIRKKIAYACRGFETSINVEELAQATISNFYEGILEEEVDQAMVLAARAKVENDPCYAEISSRLLLDIVYREALGISMMDPSLNRRHKEYFPNYIRRGISLGRLSEELLNFDLQKLQDALVIERDLAFKYLGLQTLYDRYFIHDDRRRIETPQIFWMRVAMGLSLREEHRTERAIEFYNLLSQFHFVSGTPTLFNSGTQHSQLSSCYLATVMDDLENIFKIISDDAKLSKWAGGLGNDWTNVRATGSRIKGTNGESQGVIPFLKVANDVAVAVNQGGKRKGAMCAYLETWHLDIEDFIELRKNTGDERRRTHDMNTANWIPDLFMKRVHENKSWTLFSPCDTPDLHDLYGKDFEDRYEHYERLAEEGKIRLFKKVEALTLWRKMLGMLFETGHPWITFKDPSNIRSPQDHQGVVHSSNLCTEILLNTSVTETAVCNLGSINLERHILNGKLDTDLLRQTVTTAIRMLDNVIDINFYPIPDAERSNLRHRPIGLGMMGFQDALYLMNVSYASHEAVEFADMSMEHISYYAILASSHLAKERGTYETYKGSKWDRGLLPIDTILSLKEERGGYLDQDTTVRLDWTPVRESIKAYGMRNSNTMAIAPTATIANIVGVIQSIEPSFKNVYVKSNLSGEFTIPNNYLVAKLKELDLWNEEMIDDLKYYDGSVLEIERIPDEVKQVYLTAFEIDPTWIIACASRRQKWLDMGESLNLYIDQPNGKKLHDMYMLAWIMGLKTTYYLRSRAATQIEKSTTDINKRGLQPKWMKHASASANIKIDRQTENKPKTCSLEEGCESCQ